MVTIIKKGSNRKEIQKKLSKIKSKKRLDAKKYCGTVILKEDPVKIQKKLRNEWR
jgi:hypothetical protein